MLLVRLVAALVCVALPAAAEMPRVGILASVTCNRDTPFYAGMRELGYVEGRSIEYDCVLIQDRIKEVPQLAAQMVARKPTLIVASASPAIIGAQRATSVIPIVMYGSADAIREGFVQSLARPGGNTTGLTNSSFDLLQKRLELARELVPRAKRLAVLYRSDAGPEPFMKAFTEDMGRTAPRMGFKVSYHGVADTAEAASAIEQITRRGTDLLYLVETPIFSGAHAPEMARLVAAARVPSVTGNTNLATAGGAILAVGTDSSEIAQRAARFVDRILKGAKPGDLPVEQPTRVVVLLNLRAAKAIEFAVPASLLNRADTIVE